MAGEKKEKNGKVTKEMAISEILEKKPESAGIFMKHGIHCLGCVAAHFETLEQGAKAHGINADKLVEEINEAPKEENKKKEEEKEQ
jgi:hybrid cluster-associated redox disulfide protein